MRIAKLIIRKTARSTLEVAAIHKNQYTIFRDNFIELIDEINKE